ncbi:hypothetical protein [Streptomyces sp. NPDC005017]|uniref:hypothetical protein n=1 Tax=Streptomyces sp. NPDC005017 TaxID=3364706 RepID=UPI0036764B66
MAPGSAYSAETQVLPGVGGWRTPTADFDADATAVFPTSGRPRQPSGPAGSRPLPRRERRGAAHGEGAPAPGTAGTDATDADWFGKTRGPGGASARTNGSDADATTVLPPVPSRRSPYEPGADATVVLPTDGGARRSFPDGPRTAPAPRDPWADTADVPGPAAAPVQQHDPHEVTVQMDAVQLGDVTLRPVKGGVTGQDPAADGPVFVDETGRRSRTFRRIGMAIGLACAVYAVVIVATVLSGSSDAPWLPVPQKDDRPAEQVDTPSPAVESADPSAGPSASQAADPSATAGTTPEPGVTAGGPSATSSAGATGTTADPDPTPTGTSLPKPGGGATQTDPEPTATATEPDPGPTTPTVEPPTPDPTETNGVGTGGGTGLSDSAALGAPASAQHPTFPEYVL